MDAGQVSEKGAADNNTAPFGVKSIATMIFETISHATGIAGMICRKTSPDISAMAVVWTRKNQPLLMSLISQLLMVSCPSFWNL
jgi:hypothetical protein